MYSHPLYMYMQVVMIYGIHKLYIKYGYTINLKTFDQYKFRPSVRE